MIFLAKPWSFTFSPRPIPRVVRAKPWTSRGCRGPFAASGTAVLGISADSVKRQETFRDKHRLEVPLISDEKHQMLEAYGAWGEKSMYGRTFQGIIRTTVLIGSDGRVARIWRHVRVDGHADQVLAATQAL